MFYSQQSELNNNQSSIDRFYAHTLTKATLATPTGPLFYAYAISEQAHTGIVISCGRIEGLDKYKELLWELYRNHFAVFIFDHQGQGRSYRLLANDHKGFVRHFSDYGHDLDMFNQQVVDTHWQGKKVLLGHSMGGAIAIDYLSRYAHNFSGVFLSAPMFDIHTQPVPKPVAKFIAKCACLLGFSECYAPGQGNYSVPEFALNTLTSSQIRYEKFRQTYAQTPSLQLGGVTYGWLNAAFTFISSLHTLHVNTAVFIASAQNDEIVDNRAHFAFANRQTHAHIQCFDNAKHELLFERDEIRQPLLNCFYRFCDSLEGIQTDTGSK